MFPVKYFFYFVLLFVKYTYKKLSYLFPNYKIHKNETQSHVILYLFQKRFEGTRVTVETFMNWKRNFDSEMGIWAKKDKDDKNKKLTGRELFMQDKSLNESDLKFLEEGKIIILSYYFDMYSL